MKLEIFTHGRKNTQVGESQNNLPTDQDNSKSGQGETPAPAKGSSLGGPSAQAKGSSLGGPPKQGSSLGGPPKQGSSLGGPPKQGSSLGGPPKGSSLGGPPKGSSLGGPAEAKGSSIGGPAEAKGSSIGVPPKQSSSLGGPAEAKGSSIGSAPKKGSSLGGEPAPAKKGKKKKGGGGAAKESPKVESPKVESPKVESPDENTETKDVKPQVPDENKETKDVKLQAPDQAPDLALDKNKETKDVKPQAPAEKKETKDTKAQESKSKGSAKKGAAKKGGRTALAAKVKALQAEREKQRKEEEERKIREEEEERLRLEEEKRQEEEKKRIVEERKIRKKENKLKNKAKEEQRRREKILSSFSVDAIIPALAKTNAKNPGVAKNKKKKKKAPSVASTNASLAPAPAQISNHTLHTSSEPSTSLTSSEVSQPSSEDKSKQNEDLEDWETSVPLPVVSDNWEDTITDPSLINSSNSLSKEEQEKKLKQKEEEERRNMELKQKEEKKKLEEEKAQKEEEKKKAEASKIKNFKKSNLRSPICCVLGHVDAGKTKLLDKIRRSSVQLHEAGGITQQIGATFFPLKNLQEQTARLNQKYNLQIKIPGLLIMDTPGHASFTNLRSRGSSLCDIAILVVNILEGLKPQTIESIDLLKQRKTPFVVAVNKVDRIYGWKSIKGAPFTDSLKAQEKHVKIDFETKITHIIGQLAGQELNAKLYYLAKGDEFRQYVSLIPTSAETGEGIPDLLLLLIQLTQNYLTKKLLQLATLQCSVLEVKMTEGFGYTIDVILANGVLRIGERIVLCGLNGPIETRIRALLSPAPLKELRIKTSYERNEEVRASAGLKIAADDLEHAVAGSSLFVVGPDDDIEDLKLKVMVDLKKIQETVSKCEKGVYVQASTLGSLEALFRFLKEEKIPVSGLNIGNIRKKDITLASTMLQKNCPEYACILAFDVKISEEMRLLAQKEKVRIFESDVIYQLTEQFKKYMDDVRAEIRASAKDAVFPCVLEIIPEFVIHARSPILVGVRVLDGVVKSGTPIVVPSKSMLEVGSVTSIEKDNKPVSLARKGDEVAIKIERAPGEQILQVGRHFYTTDLLYSRISRESLNALKQFFKDEINGEMFQLLVKLKKVFGIL
eukprot:TRINITY_DN2510_c0_g1_i4.p1 TRINITY_DN2510_c0_g1~~TRINITY_DN2510_c0_g1_i4.p1  ORF type:complete len:1122 (-),score=321.45 TRINITY_DN2510_c0_g1_i4:75-3440(-)